MGDSRRGAEAFLAVNLPDDLCFIPIERVGVELSGEIRQRPCALIGPFGFRIAPEIAEHHATGVTPDEVRNVDGGNVSIRNRQQPDFWLQALTRREAASDFEATISLGKGTEGGQHTGRVFTLLAVVTGVRNAGKQTGETVAEFN